jgi:hypothetical protein
MNLRRNQAATRRRGVILLVVLAMLTLFAIAGITFVLYANAASESARISRDAESYSTSYPDMDPSTSFNFFLAQLIYGVNDNDPQYVESALRGHSLAETMYGSWDSIPNNVPSDVAFSGTGRLNEGPIYPNVTDSSTMVNYTWFQTQDPTFLRDPSRLGSRQGPPQPQNLSNWPRGTYTGGQNPPYTFPDKNNMFLATISSSGQVTTPSYVRSAIFGSYAQSNANWTSNQGKYQTLRPRPIDMGNSTGTAFPYPDATTGCDVKNLPSSTSPDSPWIDVGAPILSTAAGLRYKMLVAPLVLDLDNRINLNVVGNILASNNGHASNQGWGPWEVNMGYVLNQNNVANTGPEWPNLFVGNPNNGAPGRYGPNGVPNATFTPSGPVPHLYAQGDLDATGDPRPAAVTSSPYTLPAAGGGFFPTFPPAYGNGSAQETTNHPMFFNLFTPVGDDKLFALKSHASLMWAGVNASPGSELVQLGPNNFKATDPTTGTLSRIHQTTVLSMDMDRPGAAPYIYDPTQAAYAVAYNVTAPGNASYTSTGVTAQTFPTVSPLPRQVAPAQQGEFDPTTWRSTLAATLTRINLNRPLATYASNGGNQPPDRQQFAMDIFWRLLNVTGMDVNGTMPVYTLNSTGAANGSVTASASVQQYATMRWLAQLSANIVDFIDTDDVMTSFQWTQTNMQPNDTGYVFGTELPKLVVNEVYLEYDNDSMDPNPNPGPPPVPIAATKQYHMNVWTELLNPLPSGTDPNDAANGSPVNNANLMNGTTAVYQIVITSPNKGLRHPANLVGDPDGSTSGTPPFATQTGPPAPQSYTLATTPYDPNAAGGQVLAVVNNWQGVQTVTPVGSTQSITPGAATGGTSQGFLVVGPPNPPLTMGPAAPAQTAGTQTQIQTSIPANNMSYTVKNPLTTAGDAVPPAPTILLQRLANPNLAYQPNASTATAANPYNPYVTVDYVDMQQVNSGNTVQDARHYNSMGPNAAWSQPTTPTSDPHNRFSFGRNQPYAAVEALAAPAAAPWQQQVFAPVNPPQTANQPTASFFSVNAGAAAAVAPDWLVHLDRPLISPVELLNVSGFKPHELTQQFYKDSSGNFQHVAPWTNQTFLLYRLLEFCKVNNNMGGPNGLLADGGRVPGKININTIDPTNKAVFQALCDAQPGNTFSATTGAPNDDVTNAFNAITSNRPFWSVAEGLSTGTNTQPGITQTLLNSGLQNPTLNSGAAHPYQKMELLNKIFNNVTTRSNTFAVWLTVGFFPITNDQVQPNQLGPEINLAQGRNIRHHMFAIVDRTQIVTFGSLNAADPIAVHYAGPPITAGSTNVAIGIALPITNTAGHQWQIQQGSSLVFDPGLLNEETVVVQGTGPFTANFTKGHSALGNPGGVVNIISRGHPGPVNPNTYRTTNDQFVIPYSVIID